MKHCRACDVDVATPAVLCPLCGTPLAGLADADCAAVYPSAGSRKEYNFVKRLLLLLSVVGAAVCIVVNLLVMPSFYNIALSGPKITAYFFKSAVHRRFTIHTAIRQIHHFTDKFHVRHSAVRLVFPYRPKGPAALFFTPPVSRLHQIKAAFFFFRTKQTCFGLIQQAFIGLSLTIGHCPTGSK